MGILKTSRFRTSHGAVAQLDERAAWLPASHPAALATALSVVVLLTACSFLAPFALAQTEPDSPPPTTCDALTAEGIDLRCITLEATPAFVGSAGHIRMSHAPSPFGIAVARDGTPRYDLEAVVDGLPPHKRGAYVAWLVDEFLAPVRRLGVIRNGTTPLGSVALTKFRVLVSLEDNEASTERSGPLVLRGASPSSRLQAHDVAFASPLAAYSRRANQQPGHHEHGNSNDGGAMDAVGGWSMPTHKHDLIMPPGMMDVRPTAQPWLPDEQSPLPLARPQSWLQLSDGDTLSLSAIPVRRQLFSRDVVMYGFNGEFPGPLIEVTQAATIIVDFYNGLPLPTAVHWHGLRLDNRFDGVPGVTQDPVEPGESFRYEVHFPDKGIYWYHPHHREDILQDLGLYGNLLVRPADGDSTILPVNREEVLLLDDILTPFVPYGQDAANYALMGRFGNLLLVNGEPEYRSEAQVGEVVRVYLTNVSNTRTFNLRFDGAEVQSVGSDLSFFEWATPVESIVIGPAERYIVDIRYSEPGEFTVTNAVQALDHVNASFFSVVDTLGTVSVRGSAQPIATRVDRDLSARTANRPAQAEFATIRAAARRPVDKTLELTLRVDGLPPVVEQLMRSDRVYFPPVEWEGTMPMMNWASTTKEVEWVLRDAETGRENMDIAWTFAVGDLIKIRVINDRDTFHAMQHPLHIHGQRFAVIEQDGRANNNLVWKDTVLLPAGSTTDLLLEVTNPGRWMVHCHIAEHLESGMKFVFDVSE